ncbi:hypothetical protein F8388_021971 [Cannabis sativa]|uniref:Ubiquitin-like protease family profile domain-containing protein n=1 Tax=Cannabis sativa TaxID=3483 RepID=A0A7J6FG67_CANSA|nr:hypothetical protein F8388_021971 [Cannabis sativa]
MKNFDSDAIVAIFSCFDRCCRGWVIRLWSFWSSVTCLSEFEFVLILLLYTMDKSLDSIVYVKKKKMGEVSKDIIPYVDPRDSHQSETFSKNLKDQVEPGNVAFVGADSGTIFEVPVDEPKKPEVKKYHAKKKKVNVDPSNDDFVEHVESRTSSKVPVEKEIQPSAAVADSDLPNPLVRRTTRSGIKYVASKGPSPSIAEESVKKSTSFFDVDVYLKMKPEHRFPSKLQIWNNPWVIEEIKGNLTPSQKALFMTTPCSQFLKMGNVKRHVALPHLALVSEVHQEREDVEKWFLIRDRVVRFSLEEFVLITGLSPEGSFDLNDFKQKMSFKKNMFPDLTIKVIQEQVRGRFLAGEFDDDVDAVKMAIVYLLSHYLYGYENGKRVDNELFSFVDGDLSELRNIAFGKLLWDRTFHYMNLAFKDGGNIYYKIEKAKEEKDKVSICFTNLVVQDTTKPATVKDFYPVGRELKKAALHNLKFEPVYLPKKPRGFFGKFSNLEKALSKKGSSVPKDCEEKVEDSRSENLDVGGNDNEFSDPSSPEKPVVSKPNLPEYDDDEGGVQLSLVHSGLCEGRDEGGVFSYETITVDQSIFDLVDRITRAYSSPLSAKNKQWDFVSIPESASPAVEDEVEVLDVMPLQSSVAVKRQAKPGLHCRSPFVNEFGSSEPKIQNKKDKEASSELAFDPKELFPFVKEIGKSTCPKDCGGYVKWIEGARNNEKTAGDINPPFDFNIAQIDDKTWFVILQTCGEELTDLHLNVALYYLRKSILYDASVNKRVTTTCSYFDATIKGVYADFIKAKRDPSVIKYDNKVTNYILGQYNFCFQPWIGVDDVVGPCHVGVQQHWIFLHFSILRRKIFVFNSMKNTKTNQKKILSDLLPYCELLPYFLDFLNFYDGMNDISLESGPYALPKDTPIAYEFVDKLPTQSNRFNLFVLYILGSKDKEEDQNQLKNLPEDDRSCRRRSEAAIVAEALSSVDENFLFWYQFSAHDACV